ncbi:anthranilate synthase component I family protein [Oceanihabitans sp. IOP_32]|uniref:anthranilate synthase component I family protein n=1 Tax=Oceanihabitans sp. IOP_32 TaxID=2529032 RepID=UPI0012936B0A|nr:anthranilate synthase component I family protein [Oceanihabitans sp. IOP_32]QFZ53576.1 anthranilate synthase component I family protein [Oceanihabitans sp. IOP_32]
MRTTFHHKTTSVKNFKVQLLAWAQQFDDVVWLDSNNYEQNHSSFDAILAVDAFTSIKTDFYDGFEKLKDYQSLVNDWIFGYLAYDLKNDVEVLSSKNYDGLEFPDLFFFQPKKIFIFKGNQVDIQYLKAVDDEFDSDLKDITSYQDQGAIPFKNKGDNFKIHQRISKAAYLEKVNNMLANINRGDIYEANFCMEFYAENSLINPLEIYRKLNAISNAPFATFLKSSDKYVLSASPERYLKKDQNTIISQPIKGTARRSHNFEDDELLKNDLAKDEKERSENIMIVDLVRNDLSKTAVKGSVKVEELCKVYSFDQVHQMISTVTSQIEENTHPIDVIKSTFPMGSMTGAPKISAMKIIENLEETKRGLYSGAVGYITPRGDFDFNVVIRSILYNHTQKYISFSVGSAITSKSDPLKEYEECLVKAKAMHEVLQH